MQQISLKIHRIAWTESVTIALADESGPILATKIAFPRSAVLAQHQCQSRFRKLIAREQVYAQHFRKHCLPTRISRNFACGVRLEFYESSADASYGIRLLGYNQSWRFTFAQRYLAYAYFRLIAKHLSTWLPPEIRLHQYAHLLTELANYERRIVTADLIWAFANATIAKQMQAIGGLEAMLNATWRITSSPIFADYNRLLSAKHFQIYRYMPLLINL